MGYIGWAAYASLFIFGSSLPTVSAELNSAQNFSALNIITSATLAVCFSVFAIQRSPWTFYVYVIFPVLFWHQVISRIHLVIRSRSLFTIPSRQYLRILGYILLVLGALYAMVVSTNHAQVALLSYDFLYDSR
jgi:GPI ethanolamine phosphate transferase 1